jgi:hypothetical protein
VRHVADYLHKTTPQLAAAVMRLVEQGQLRLDREVSAKSDVRPDRRVFPTVQALRSLPAFEKLSTEQIERELAALESEIEP